jgi:multiple sugar transport system substrate-binding protein
MRTTRRRLIAGASVLAMPAIAQTQRRVTIMSHAVHQRAATGSTGGDSTAAWRAKHNATIEWLTFGIEAVHERVYREAGLAQGSVDVAFLLERYGGPHIATLFEDLRPYMERDPLEDVAEISPSMFAAHTYGNRSIAVPYRHATHGFFWNQALFEERGVSAVPTTFEQIVETVDRMTFTRSDGSRVAGYALSMDDPSAIMDVIRAHGGDFITREYRFVADSEQTVRAITLIRDWYRKGALPRNVMTFKTEEVITTMQQGRAAMTNQPYGRFVNYNDPKQSRYPGRIAVRTMPALATLRRDGLVPAKTSVWAMAIPRNAPDKDLSWSLIKELSSKESPTRAAVNGNGPVRMSAYDDPRVKQLAPWAEYERQVLPTAMLVVPGFEQAGRAMDVFMEEVQKAMLGQSEPAAAMKAAKARIEPMLPS